MKRNKGNTEISQKNKISRQSTGKILSSKGHALIEFAFILPLMGLLLVGGIDFARVFYAGVTLTNSVRAGLSYGHLSVDMSTEIDQIKQKVVQAGQDLGLELDMVDVQNICECADGTPVSCGSTSCSDGSPYLYVKVTADWTFQTLVDYPGIPHTVAMHREGWMRAR